MTMSPTPVNRWQKSSFSGVDGEDCVEVAHAAPHVLLRESDSPATVLMVPPVSLLALIRQVRTLNSASIKSRAS
ncbi:MULTISPECIES: DUF397 domain-containing protein [Streptomyces]|uniref:DUF397 domain-containing protein n=2 Tax=Streptomyces TaxID=1883 RepID=A0ABV9J3S6_9ACTN